MTHLGGGSGNTSSTLIYSLMQSKRRANTDKNHLLNLEHLFVSKSIGLPQYLKSAASLVGRVVGNNSNSNGNNQANAGVDLVEDEDTNG